MKPKPVMEINYVNLYEGKAYIPIPIKIITSEGRNVHQNMTNYKITMGGKPICRSIAFSR